MKPNKNIKSIEFTQNGIKATLKPIAILQQLDLEQKSKKYPNTPYLSAYKYTQNSANGITRCIVDYVNFIGGMAERINTMGRIIDNTKVVGNVLGQKMTIGSKQYIPTSGVKGSADISITYKGQAIKCEVKYKKDRQSTAQKEYEQRITEAGGLYFIAKSFDEFYTWFNEVIK